MNPPTLIRSIGDYKDWLIDTLPNQGRWTEEDAAQWWAQSGAELEKATVRHNPMALTGTQTVVTNSLGRVAA